MAHLRACLVLSLLVGLVVLGAWASPGAALEEADRLFLVGEKAFDDGLYPLSRRMLERFVERFPSERRAPAAAAFQRLVSEFPDHALAPTATIQLARTLIELKRAEDVQGVLQAFVTKNPEHKLAPEARYWQARARLAAGQTDQGVTDLRAFAKTNPTSELAPAARRAVLDTLMKDGRKSELADEYTALMSQ